jgi:hypothetical protein
MYFNGNIHYINDSLKRVKNITSKTVAVDGAYYGMMSVYDSLIIFWNPKLPHHLFNIFNVDTGEEIGSFFPRGQGPDEALSVNCVFQFFKKGNDIMTLLLASNERKLFVWNITKSIENKKTVFDTIVSFNKPKNKSYLFLFNKNEDTLLAYVSSNNYFLTEDEATMPLYEKRTMYTDSLIQDYPIYKIKTVRRKSEAFSPLDFFYTWDVLKPDGSKIVQAMRTLPQINILDVNTGNVVGYRMPKSPDFSYFEKNIQSVNIYYNSIHANDNYIYATYWGKEDWDARIGAEVPHFNTIHVFDWNGNQLYELSTDRVFFRIWLDNVRNRLYTVNTDEVYYLDLDELNL